MRGKRIGMFSYGSGLASSMFSLQITNDVALIEPLAASLKNVPLRLEARAISSPADYTAILKTKEDSYNKGVYIFSLVNHLPYLSLL